MICVGVNDDSLIDGIRSMMRESSYDIGINETFRGAIIPNGLSGDELSRTTSIMLEIRKDMYLDGG